MNNNNTNIDDMSSEQIDDVTQQNLLVNSFLESRQVLESTICKWMQIAKEQRERATALQNSLLDSMAENDKLKRDINKLREKKR